VQIYALIGNIIELFLGVDLFFWRTIAWIVTVWVDHHPKIEEKLETVVAITTIAKGGKGAGGALKKTGKGAGPEKGIVATRTALEETEATKGATIRAEGERGVPAAADTYREGEKVAEPTGRKGSEEVFGIPEKLERPIRALEKKLVGEEPVVEEDAGPEEEGVAIDEDEHEIDLRKAT